ncbi:hypothetical protein [Leptospirillum ferriphilum]|jgi:hypothetical protein|uniref:Uncharacterized protein n=1 Tax=Leptospirillum ferriphilum YSK TaxID=1441628 RepID=A0A059XYH8_9BACT|nr:hypothetical protein [Leptospirillum ferriphilum]AIA31973.1 hypothetical protein Y981_11335 [Leptospirillum ferriphilum YSK]
MPEYFLRSRIREEIGKIPGERLPEILDRLRAFQEGPQDSVLPFAGSWNDMGESDFKDFMEELDRRRHKTLQREPPIL